MYLFYTQKALNYIKNKNESPLRIFCRFIPKIERVFDPRIRFISKTFHLKLIKMRIKTDFKIQYKYYNNFYYKLYKSRFTTVNFFFLTCFFYKLKNNFYY